MKPFLLLLFLLSCAAYAQGAAQCSQTLTFTGAGTGTVINTTSGSTAGCVGWRLTWSVTGFTAAQIQLEGSQDNSTFAAFTGSVVIEGSNPTNWTAATASNTIVVRASQPYIQVNVVSVGGGPGTVKTTLYGYVGTSAQMDAGSIIPVPLTVPLGGTGDTTLAAHGVLIGEGTNPIAVTSPGVSPQCFISNGATVDPSFQPCPFAGSLTYYLTDTASSVATYLQQTIAPFTPKTTLPFASEPIGTDVLQNWATNAGVPGLPFIPAGVYTFHIHAAKTGGGNAVLFAEFWEVSSVGVDIAKIGTTEVSDLLPGTEHEFVLQFVDGNVYPLASTASRIVCRVFATVTAFATDIALYVGDEADSHISLPANVVDVSNYVPYTGAVANVVLGAHGLSAGLGGVGAVDFSAGSSSVPARTGTGSPVGTNCSKVGDVFFQTDATAGENFWLATTFGTPCTWSQITGIATNGGHVLTAGFDGAGVPLLPGKVAYMTMPYACTLAAWNITVDTGTATVDVWKRASGTAIPTVANSITNGAPPTIAANTAVHSTAVGTWTTQAVTANDIFGFNLSAVSSATLVNLSLQCN